MLLRRFSAQKKRKEYRAMEMGNRGARKVPDRGKQLATGYRQESP